MKILIIGGSGVLSSAIVRHFVAMGACVSIVTDGMGILPLPSGIKHHYLVDRNNASAFKNAVNDGSDWDLIVDCICYSAEQARMVIELLKKRCRHLIAVSSYLVYENSGSLLSEKSPLIKPENHLSYEYGKISMEACYLESGLPVSIIRLPHILGDGAQLGILPMHNRDSWLIRRIQDGKPLFLADGGDWNFQFVYTDDVAEVVSKMALLEASFCEIYNCANPEVFSAYDYYQKIAVHLGKSLSIANIESKLIRDSNWGWLSTMNKKLLDVSKLKKSLNKTSWVNISDALESSLKYLKRNLQNVEETYRLFDRLEELHSKKNSFTPNNSKVLELINECAVRRKRSALDIRLSK